MTRFQVTGMSCAACSARVEKAAQAVPGVTSAAVNLLTNSMVIEGDASAAEVISAVEKAGYGASVMDGNTKQQSSAPDSLADTETPVLRRRLIASLCFLIPLMYLSMGHMMWGWPLPAFLSDNHLAIGLAQLILTVIVMVINQKFFINGFAGLLHRAPNMDTLVALGSGASFLYSTYALFAMTGAVTAGDTAAAHEYMMEFYFESAAMILTLITVGKMLEARSKGKTTDALKNLMALAPKTATLLVDGIETSVPIAQVKKGDRFVVRPGESIPVDGIILEGSCAADESALTGESVPVDKQAQDSVSAATINRSGFIVCEATRVGEDTTLSQIIRMVSDAAATKAPIAKVADKVSGIFVPTVITIALITIAVWLLAGQTVGFALARGISVLVISCPCALGLATPVAIMVGSGKGARSGILFKTAAALEAAGRTEVIALDKTGTLTYGTPRVTDLLVADGIDKQQLLHVAYALEAKSEHPLARAIMEYGNDLGITPAETTDFVIAPGNGLTALLEGQTAVGGNAAFFAARGLVIPAKLSEDSSALAGMGKTPLFFAHGGQILGVIAVADVIKENAAQVIRELDGMGGSPVMLTGDNARTAKAIAAQINISQVVSDVLPAGKEEQIRALSAQGRVAMVGDGINDAPALTRADIGIAIGAGTDVAIDAADVVLVRSRLEDIPAALRLSRAVLRNIHQNLFWAFFYNVIGIPLAAGVWIPVFNLQLSPMFGAAAMSLSSFCVVTNALRLNLIDIYDPKHDHKRKSHSHKHKNNSKETKIMKKTMKITGMMCGHCSGRVKKVLEALDAVSTADVSHETGTAVLTLNAPIADELLKSTVEAEGYQVTAIE